MPCLTPWRMKNNRRGRNGKPNAHCVFNSNGNQKGLCALYTDSVVHVYKSLACAMNPFESREKHTHTHTHTLGGIKVLLYRIVP